MAEIQKRGNFKPVVIITGALMECFFKTPKPSTRTSWSSRQSISGSDRAPDVVRVCIASDTSARPLLAPQNLAMVPVGIPRATFGGDLFAQFERADFSAILAN
jgi:hypothetical protein